jgi:CRISPR-associated protein Csm3
MRFSNITHVRARVTLASATHIGEDGSQATGQLLSTVRGGVDNMPYLPGSSIKGRMRALLSATALGRQEDPDGPTIPELFGDVGRRGLLSFWDCHLDPAWMAARLENAGDICQVQRTHQAYMKRIVPRVTEVIPAGTPFEFRLTITSPRDAVVDAVLAGMKLLEWEGIGRATSRGMGRLRFTLVHVDGYAVQRIFDSWDAPRGRQG